MNFDPGLCAAAWIAWRTAPHDDRVRSLHTINGNYGVDGVERCIRFVDQFDIDLARQLMAEQCPELDEAIIAAGVDLLGELPRAARRVYYDAVQAGMPASDTPPPDWTPAAN